MTRRNYNNSNNQRTAGQFPKGTSTNYAGQRTAAEFPLHINKYYKAVCEAYSLSNAETLYNAPIIILFEQFGCIARDTSGERGGQTGENIDIKLWRSDDNISETEPFAGVEVKKVGGIDERAKKQIKIEAERYGNAILTDNLQWQFWRTGEEKMYSGVQLIEKDGDKLTLRKDNIELFISLVEDFLMQDPASIRSSSKLAEYMAGHARRIRSIIAGILKDDGGGQPVDDERQRKLPMFPELYGLFDKIKKELRPMLSTSSFADMYAQTIVYGLFIARYNDTSPDTFDKYEAIGNLGRESKLLEEFFTHIARSGKKHPTLDGVIDKLCALYRLCDLSGLLDNDESKDTIIHFYEEFLTYYDPALRKSLGVFYTPVQAVRYLVSQVDRVLVEDFGILGGLSNNEQINITVQSEQYFETSGRAGRTKKELDTKEISVPRVAILDPATGTGSFLAEIIKYVKETYFSGGREAFYKEYILDENGLLSRLIGFEIMMTSYVVAHLKLRRTISDTLGYVPEEAPATNIFMTNTLAAPQSERERNEQTSLFDLSAAISDEAYHADTWKTRRPIKVIIGNPPYLAASTNPYDISAYKTETDGVTKLNEKNSKMLGDDYVKFFRFSQEIIEKTGEGVLAFVSNKGYLDNPTFRGMRASLLRTFDKIYIVNLHGNSLKQETAPDGSKDENIFDIMQGVSLFIGIKGISNNVSLRATAPQETLRSNPDERPDDTGLLRRYAPRNDANWAKVYYTDLWGTRESKFQCLENGNLDFNEITPDSKMAYFVPIDDDEKRMYEKGICIAELLNVYTTGVNSGNDKVAIAPSQEQIRHRIETVRNAIDKDQILELFGKLTGGQTTKKIQDDVISNNGIITRISYRPFDTRWTYYSGMSSGWLDRPREQKVMGHMLIGSTSPIGKNIGLVIGKSAPITREFAMVLVSDAIIEKGILDTVDRAYIAPLYLYDEFTGAWSPNFDNDNLSRLTENMSSKPEPIEVFDYIYGILYDPVYRERYNEFLKRDFPRVPIINAPRHSVLDQGSRSETLESPESTQGIAGQNVSHSETMRNDADGNFHVSEEMFRAYVTAGERLRKLHLMQEKVPTQLAIEPNDSDDMEIGAVKYKDGVLHINKNKRLLGIPQDVWEYRIGGYQVFDKWLKSHKGETLNIDSFDHICNVAGLLVETIKIQQGLRELHSAQ